MLKIKNTIIKIKNAFDKLTSRMDMSEKRISEPEDIFKENSKTEKAKRTKIEKQKAVTYM